MESYTLQSERNIIIFFYRNCKYNENRRLNAVFDEDIKKIGEGDESWKLFNTQNTRALLISAMFDSGCSLEEISYLTGASVSQILRYVTNEQIIKAGEKRWKNGSKKGKNNHPFNDIFDGVL